MKKKPSKKPAAEARKAAPDKSRARLIELLGLTLVIASVFLLLGLASYSPTDGTEGNAVRNWTGIVGHMPVHLLVLLTGVAAWPLIFLPGAFGISLLRHRPVRADILQVLGFLLLVVSVAGFAELVTETISFRGAAVESGGLLGDTVAAFAVQYANEAGAVVAFVLLSLIGVTLATGLRVVTILNAVRWVLVLAGKTGFRGAARAADWLAKRLEQKRRHKEFLQRKADEIAAARLAAPEPEPENESESTPKDPPIPELHDDTEATDFPLPPPPKKGRKKKKDELEIRRLEEPRIQGELAIPRRAGNFELPPLKFLELKKSGTKKVDQSSLEFNSRLLEKKLADFGVSAKVVAVQPGPVVTMYELEPASGVKVNKFTNLDKDIAMAMKAISVRVVAPIPGKNVVGIEIPNHERDTVFLKEIIASSAFQNPKLKIPMALGKNISGEPVVADLAQMPHLLVAGSTGSGKSVSINSMICSVLYRYTPDQVKFVLVDPKMIELSAYDGIPHLRTPVITNPKKAAIALRRCVDEMERRYELMKAIGRAKDLDTYNRRVQEQKKADPEAKLKIRNGEGVNATEEEVELEVLPYWVIVIDELADLMSVAKKDIEDSIARLAAKARACGLHLIVATQRPSTDVITGVIKSNLPTRLSFQVASSIDSRTILDSMGAENLLGQGDSLFIPPKSSRIDRVHGAWISEDEIGNIVEFLREQAEPVYDEGLLQAKPGEEGEGGEAGGDGDDDKDELYDQVVHFVMTNRRASTSAIQRKFKIGYNRAARILDQMEDDGLVGPPNGSSPRDILRESI